MNSTTCTTYPIDRGQSEKQYFASQATANGGTPPFGGSVDPIVIAFFMLVEASNITTQSAMLHAKELGSNASAQEKLNAEAAQLKWCSVPTLQTNKHSMKESNKHTSWVTHGRGFTYSIKIWYTHPNQDVFNNAQAQNQAVSAARQMISDQLNVLQQTAQISESNINTLTDESMQTMQEGSNMMQILQSLTFQALLRQPPQN